MSEESKIIKYLESQGYENSVIGTVSTPSHSVTNDPYHMSVGKVTVASCMAQYIDSTRQSPDVEGIYKITDLKRMGFTEIKDLLESQRDVIRICNKRLTEYKNKSPESKKIEEVLSRLELTIYGLSQAMVNTGSVSASSVLDTLTKIKSTLEGGK